MRKEFFIGGTFDDAEVKCPWAVSIIEVDGGYMCFESVEDHEAWQSKRDPAERLTAIYPLKIPTCGRHEP